MKKVIGFTLGLFAATMVLTSCVSFGDMEAQNQFKEQLLAGEFGGPDTASIIFGFDVYESTLLVQTKGEKRELIEPIKNPMGTCAFLPPAPVGSEYKLYKTVTETPTGYYTPSYGCRMSIIL